MSRVFRHPRRVLTALAIAMFPALLAHAATMEAVKPGGLLPAITRDWPVDRQIAKLSPGADAAWKRAPAQGIAYIDSVLGVGWSTRNRTLIAAAHAVERFVGSKVP